MERYKTSKLHGAQILKQWEPSTMQPEKAMTKAGFPEAPQASSPSNAATALA
jgi:hypothetical protein